MATSALHTIARQLCAHVAALKQQHRAGITPSYGQVEDLFDFGERLSQVLDSGEATPPPLPRCSNESCAAPATTTIAGQAYCGTCAHAVRQLLRDLEGFKLHTVRMDWPRHAGTVDGRVSGPDPRD